MTDFITEHYFRCDLADGPCVSRLTTQLMHQDDQADRFTVSLWRRQTPADLTDASAYGYLYLASTDQTILLKGEITGAGASVTLTGPCYQTPGRASLVIQLHHGETRHTVLKADFVIARTGSQEVIDPEGVVPELADILGMISQLEASIAQGQSDLAAMESDFADLLASSNASVNQLVSDTQAQTAALTTQTEEATQDLLDQAQADMDALTAQTQRELNALASQTETAASDLLTQTQQDVNQLVSQAEIDSAAILTQTQQDIDAFISQADADNTNMMTQVRLDADALISQTTTDAAALIAQTSSDTEALVTQAQSDVSSAVNEAYAAALDARSALNTLSAAAAPAIIPTATGETVTIADSAARSLQGLTLYGKTTQDGTPTPDAPVELVNIGNNGSITVQITDGGSVTALTTNGLPGIPATSGGNYTDENGQQWVCDEVDFGRGVYVQRVARATITGAEGMDSTGKLFQINHDGAKPEYAYDHHVRMMCDHYIPMTLSGVREAESGIAQYAEKIYIRDARWSTVEEATQALQAMGCKTMYQLATPIETALTEEELAAYAAMTSQYPNTTVTNDAGAGMAVKYIADTKNYIDRKIAAIAAATV